jgi:hypothetical protein
LPQKFLELFRKIENFARAISKIKQIPPTRRLNGCECNTTRFVMVRSSSLSLTTLGLSSALCLMSAMSPSFAAKPEQLKNRAMGTKVDCRGAHSCASWLTTNFAGKRPLAILANDRWIVSIAPLGRSLPGQGPGVEDDSGNEGTEPPGTGGDIPTEDGGAAADDNNGHGNDPGHVDDSNPGNSSDNQNGGADNNGSDNGNAGGSSNNGSSNSDTGNGGQHDDNGHGNDPGHSDNSNPGKGK